VRHKAIEGLMPVVRVKPHRADRIKMRMMSTCPIEISPFSGFEISHNVIGVSPRHRLERYKDEELSQIRSEIANCQTL
jgi:hypothetical protein